MGGDLRLMRVLVVSADRTLSSGNPLNIGDALLTQALADELLRRDFHAEIADFGGVRAPGSSENRHIRLNGIQGLIRAVRAADAVVIGGGTLVQDDAKSGPPWRGLPRLLLVTVVTAKAFGKRVAFFGVGSNPVRRAIPRFMLRMALIGTPVWARDELTAELLKSQWNKPSLLAADTALLARLDTNTKPQPQPLVVAAYAAEIETFSSDYLQSLRSEFGSLEFISMHQGTRADADAISPELRDYFDAVHRDVSVDTAVGIFRRSSAVLSSRMHALYLGLLLDKPMISLSQRPKVASFRREYDIPISVPEVSTSTDADLVSFAPRRANSHAVAAAQARLDKSLNQLVEFLRTSRQTRRSSTTKRAPQ